MPNGTLVFRRRRVVDGVDGEVETFRYMVMTGMRSDIVAADVVVNAPAIERLLRPGWRDTERSRSHTSLSEFV